jgi:hyperosmotically inducible protein
VGSRLSSTTHAAELNAVKEAINTIGTDYRNLLELRPGALPWQQSVIDRLEPLLVGMAGQATDAIALLNKNSGPVRSQEYRNAIGNLYDYAGQTRSLLAVNLDYAQAREKLNRLDASTEEAVAKVSEQGETTEVSSKTAKQSKSLEERVAIELLKLPYYGVFDHLAFQVTDEDRITLVGDVTWPTLRTDAEWVVSGVEGVAGVTNEITVLPLSPNDDRLRMAAYRAIYGQPAMTQYRLNPHPPIRIIVENGHITLKGVVAREMDRNMANIQASSVPGAFSVTNHLEIGS